MEVDPASVASAQTEDDVFLSSNSIYFAASEGVDSFCSDLTHSGQNLMHSDASCQCKEIGRHRHCSECLSHSKVPSRQEHITDDTPQMHRTDESVWSSYAAKNLRSLRRGSYSENSDEGENKENETDTDHSRVSLDCESHGLKMVDKLRHCQSLSAFDDIKAQCANNSVRQFQRRKPRKLVKTKSFCYPSDDEDIGSDLSRYHARVRFAKKRSFCDVEVSPVRRTHSVDSGLTQEFRLLRCNNGEPLYKRSSSIPRTRIRFHSGQKGSADSPIGRMTSHTCKMDSPSGIVDSDKSKMDTSALSSHSIPNKTRECLQQIRTDCKNLYSSDNLVSLSADEQRLVEGHSGHSDTSASESDKTSQSGLQAHRDAAAVSISEVQTKSHDFLDSSLFRMQETDVYTSTSRPLVLNSLIDVHASNTDTPDCPFTNTKIVDKRLAKLQKPMVSSLRSETGVEMPSPNLSCIQNNSGAPPRGICDMDVSSVSVFSPLVEPSLGTADKAR